MELTPEQRDLEKLNSGNGKTTKTKPTKGKIAKVEGTAGSLATKSKQAQNAAIATADRDAVVFAQTYMERFDANMQALSGKLGEVWQTIGDYEELADGEEMPPFSEQLDQLFSG